MWEALTDYEAEVRARCDASLRDCFPAHAQAIALGWELVWLLSDRSAPQPDNAFRRFMHQEVAVIGDSIRGIRFHPRDGDFTCYRAYFRIAIYPGDPPKPPQCVHYEACALGTVHTILPEFGQAALLVPAEHYVINQSF
ncbi:MAG TPA: hypothetical protein VIT91_08240 [Chthoniobacterales bacterium]